MERIEDDTERVRILCEIYDSALGKPATARNLLMKNPWVIGYVPPYTKSVSLNDTPILDGDYYQITDGKKLLHNAKSMNFTFGYYFKVSYKSDVYPTRPSKWFSIVPNDLPRFSMDTDPLMIDFPSIKRPDSSFVHVGRQIIYYDEDVKQTLADWYGFELNPIGMNYRESTYMGDLWDGILNKSVYPTILPRFDERFINRGRDGKTSTYVEPKRGRPKENVVDTHKEIVKPEFKAKDVIHRKCYECNKVILTTRGDLKRSRGLFCSTSCGNAYRKYGNVKVANTCDVCGTHYEAYNEEEFCSDECKSFYLKKFYNVSL